MRQFIRTAQTLRTTMDSCAVHSCPHLNRLACRLPECPLRRDKVATPKCNAQRCGAALRAPSPLALSPTVSLTGFTSSVSSPANSDAADTTISDLHQFRVPLTPIDAPWLDTGKPYNDVYFKTYGDDLASLSDSAVNPTYYTLTAAGEAGLERRTAELHDLFASATGHVLSHLKQYGAYFGFPEKLWPLIQHSWNAHLLSAAEPGSGADILSGRFDWALTEDGVKCYEYNADSASCYLEAGEVQGAWSNAAGLGTVGLDAGRDVFARLVDGFRALRLERPAEGITQASQAPPLLHMLIDEGGEERYHALYMQAAANAAGLRTKLVVGRPDALGWAWAPDGSGSVIDAEGEPVTRVWKTWAWNTIIGLTSDADYDFIQRLVPSDSAPIAAAAAPPLLPPTPLPGLQHVLLDPRIRVFEPLWTVLPSSKAILPVLSEIAPSHPSLLTASFALTPELRLAGYVTKPINGRAGRNVELHDKADPAAAVETTVTAASAAGVAPARDDVQQQHGSSSDLMYQELCVLPRYDDLFVQVNTCVVGGRFAGTVLRCSNTAVIDYASNIYALRIIS